MTMVDRKETTVVQTQEPPMTRLDEVKDHAAAVEGTRIMGPRWRADGRGTTSSRDCASGWRYSGVGFPLLSVGG